MSGPPDQPEPCFFSAKDGQRLAFYELAPAGDATRTVVLIHGLFSNAWTNWVRYGHAAKLVARGFRVVMPDLRGHGRSAAPHDPACYPPDVLADDGEALIAHLALTDYDLGGYSLGGRTTLRMLVRGAGPARAVVAGMGLEGLLHTSARGEFFKGVLERVGEHRRGTPEWMAEAFLKTTGGDPRALLPLLDTFVDTSRAAIAAVATPLLVLTGIDDRDNGSSEALAALLPHGVHRTVPGNHMSAVLRPELGDEIATFLEDMSPGR